MPDFPKAKRTLLLLPALGAFILLSLRAREAAGAAAAGIRLCLNTVIPSLFPFLILSGRILGVGIPERWLRLPGKAFERAFHIRGSALPALLIGLFGGCPLGAEAAAEAYRRGCCSREEAGRLLIFSNNCSPGFLLGFVGTQVFGVREAILLLVLQWTVSLWLGLLLGAGKAASAAGGETEERQRTSPAGLVASAVLGGARSMLSICAYVVFFSVCCAFLPENALLRGLAELTGGLALCPEKGASALAEAAFLVGWGGLSVAFQVYSAAEKARLPTRLYLPLRLLHGAVMALCVLALRLGPFYAVGALIPAASAAILVKSCRNKRPGRV